MSGFNPAQRQAIAGFLLVMPEVHGQKYHDFDSPLAALGGDWAPLLSEDHRVRLGSVEKSPKGDPDGGRKANAAYYAAKAAKEGKTA